MVSCDSIRSSGWRMLYGFRYPLSSIRGGVGSVMINWEMWRVLRVEDVPPDGRLKASLKDVASADLVITTSGRILKDRHGITKLAGDR